ncbi:LCP family protein [Bacillus weihaiensis]|uniref:LCP family protein n=1 Tax=Bacillus weihaiensis TaxID=1547283 RepID=UPI0023557F79|nr:LCP family protein [Bacillus weihaiensis]
MDKKELKNRMEFLHDKELEFTSEDRKKVFDQLANDKKVRKKSSLPPQLFPVFSVVLLLLVFSGVLLPTIFNKDTNQEFQQEETQSETVVQKQMDSTNMTFLLMGIDENNRADANVLVSYDQKDKSMILTSIPRDTYVPVLDEENNEVRKDKLANSYAYGGATSTVKSVSSMLNLSIDYYAAVDTMGFIEIINSMGGITYNLAEPMSIGLSNGKTTTIEKGQQHLDGEMMLGLLKERITLPNGAFGRNENHVEFIRSLVSSIRSSISLKEVKEYVEHVDTDLPIYTMYSFAMEAEINKFKTLNLSEQAEDVKKDGIYYVELNEYVVNQVAQDIRDHDIEE